jgi:hypothetical protein
MARSTVLVVILFLLVATGNGQSSSPTPSPDPQSCDDVRAQFTRADAKLKDCPLWPVITMTM